MDKDQPYPQQLDNRIILYCGTCRREKQLNTNISLHKYIGRRLSCKTDDNRRHWMKVITNSATKKFWLNRESDIYQVETRISPMRWWKNWGKFTEGKAGRYLTVRFILLMGFLFLAYYIPDYNRAEWIISKIFVFLFTFGFVLDILIVNTSTAFVSRNPQDPIRSAVFLIFALIQLIIAFAVFYILDKDSFYKSANNLNPIQAIYLSMATITTLGHGSIYPDLSKWTVQLLIFSEMISGFYFIGLLVATIISQGVNSQDNSPISIEDLERNAGD
jgi:hypothetical protein